MKKRFFHNFRIFNIDCFSNKYGDDSWQLSVVIIVPITEPAWADGPITYICFRIIPIRYRSTCAWPKGPVVSPINNGIPLSNKLLSVFIGSKNDKEIRRIKDYTWECPFVQFACIISDAKSIKVNLLIAGIVKFYPVWSIAIFIINSRSI